MNNSLTTLIFILIVASHPIQLSADPDTTIYINAVAGMQYDKVQIKVIPGSKVKLVLRNKDDMSHNLVITKTDSRVKVVEKALALAERGPELDFIPDIPEVLWTIPVLSPGEEKSVTFKVPDKETQLPYVCTFPGHGFVMYGILYVTNGKLPPMETDDNIPENRRAKRTSSEGTTDRHMEPPHPYKLEPPYYYRIFMPDASPASIAVRLTDEISYCWDAGPCQLLYAWKGGFVDNSVAWKGHKNTESGILGAVFHREQNINPILIGSENPLTHQIKFKGYRLKNGNPEFHYQIDGTDVYEIFEVSDNGRNLERIFRIPSASEKVRIKITETVTASTGVVEDGYLTLTPEQSRLFSLKIPIKDQQ